jgi:hypothetical protein
MSIFLLSGKWIFEQPRDYHIWILLLLEMGFNPLWHAVLCGVAGFSATVIGSIFFKVKEGYLWMGMGVLLFLLANQVMLKFQFNSHQLNGATLTTILTFLSQVVCLALYKRTEISLKWLLGAACILSGSYLLKVESDNK